MNRMHDTADKERDFYALRSRAFGAEPLAQDDVRSLFPSEPNDEFRPAIFCADAKYPAHILKMGWLLGEAIRIITPHIAYRYTHTDVSKTHDYPETVSVDRDLIDWRNEFGEQLDDGSLELLPAIQLTLAKTSDPIDKWENTATQVTLSNLTQPDVIPADSFSIESLPPITIDLPQLIFKDLALLKKVQRDYPIAAIEFMKLLRDSCAAARKDHADDSPQDILEHIHAAIVVPGVEKIQHEYRQLLKNQAIATSTEIAGISLPLTLSYAVTPEEFYTKLFGAGIGLLIARGVNALRNDVLNQKNGPFFAATKLGL